MFKKLRATMAGRDGRYLLDGLIELNNANEGQKHPPKRSRGAKRQKPVLFAVLSDCNVFMSPNLWPDDGSRR